MSKIDLLQLCYLYVWVHNWIMLFLTNKFLSLIPLLPASTSAEKMVDTYDGIHPVVVSCLILQYDFIMDFVQKLYTVFWCRLKKNLENLRKECILDYSANWWGFVASQKISPALLIFYFKHSSLSRNKRAVTTTTESETTVQRNTRNRTHLNNYISWCWPFSGITRTSKCWKKWWRLSPGKSLINTRPRESPQIIWTICVHGWKSWFSPYWTSWVQSKFFSCFFFKSQSMK